MDALDAHPGKGRKEEVVQQPCNHRAEKLPRNRRERKTERDFTILFETVLKKVLQYPHISVSLFNVYVEMFCCFLFSFS